VQGGKSAASGGYGYGYGYGRGFHLENIWEVCRGDEDASYKAFDAVGNRRLLWHGTNVAVVAAILKTGLRIMPSVNGGRVGRGIYLADALEKSNTYVRHHRRADGTMLGMVFLVEAALGTMAEITRDDGSLVKAPNGYHSVLAKGTVAPDMYGPVKPLNVSCTQGSSKIRMNIDSYISFAGPTRTYTRLTLPLPLPPPRRAKPPLPPPRPRTTLCSCRKERSSRRVSARRFSITSSSSTMKRSSAFATFSRFTPNSCLAFSMRMGRRLHMQLLFAENACCICLEHFQTISENILFCFFFVRDSAAIKMP
jgi:hypothetical protein